MIALGQTWEQLTSTGTLSQATVYGYDGVGNTVSVQAPLDRATGNSYDFLNRLTRTWRTTGRENGYSSNELILSLRSFTANT
jgi:hypothetical protein